MDTDNDEDAVASGSLKRLKPCDENKDFISELPDSILVHILSFLPLEDAIKTFLLRRFGNLWCSIPVLDLNSCLYHDCRADEYDPCFGNEKFLGIIRHVMKPHNCDTLDKLCLCFNFVSAETREEFADLLDPSKNYSEKEKDIAEQIEKLIGHAINRNVKVLDLNFRGCNWGTSSTHYELPDVFSSKYLTDLRLTGCDFVSVQNMNLKLLRSLLLCEVSLSDDVMEKFLLCCSLLEDLSLINCHGLSKLNCKNPNTKKVMLTLSTKDGPLIIPCPFVLSLKIDGWIEQAYLLNISSVADVSIHFSYLFRCEKKRYESIRRLLQKLRQCKTFTICRWSVLVLSVWTLRNVPCPSFGWKNLTLELGLTKWHQLGLSLLLRSSLSVESLTMYVYAGWEFMFTTDEGKWIQEHEFDLDYYWQAQEATFPNLESIQMFDYVNEPYMIEMVRFLLESAPRLKKMVITAKENLEPHGQNLFRISQLLLYCPRASSEAMIFFS